MFDRKMILVVFTGVLLILSAGCAGLETPTATPIVSTMAATTVPDTSAPTALPDTADPTQEQSTSTPDPESTTEGEEPAVLVSPLQVAAGREVTVKVRGFPPSADLEIGIGRVNSEYDVLTRAQSEENGSLTSQVTVPDFVSGEDEWVFVVSAQNSRVQAVSDTLQVAAGEEGSIHLSRHSAQVEQELTINGVGFPPASTVELGIGRMNSEYDLVSSTETDAAGAFQALFTIPDFVDPQDQWVLVAVADKGRVKVFSEEIKITE